MAGDPTNPLDRSGELDEPQTVVVCRRQSVALTKSTLERAEWVDRRSIEGGDGIGRRISIHSRALGHVGVELTEHRAVSLAIGHTDGNGNELG